MNDRNLFRYVDNVRLSDKMKRELINGYTAPREAEKPIFKKNFAVLGGIAAMLCVMLTGVYIFLLQNSDIFNDPSGNVLFDDSGAAGSTIFHTTTPPPSYTVPNTWSQHDIELPEDEARCEPNIYSVFIYPFQIEETLMLFDSLGFHPDYSPSEAFLLRYYKELDTDTSLARMASRLRDTDIIDIDDIEELSIMLRLIENHCNEFLQSIAFTDMFGEPDLGEMRAQGNALKVARAFVENDTEFLLRHFQVPRDYDHDPEINYFMYHDNDYFDFIKDLDIISFTQTGKEHDPDIIGVYIYYFDVQTANDRNGLTIGNKSGREWFIRSESFSILEFSPVGRETNRMKNNSCELTRACYNLTMIGGFITKEENQPVDLQVGFWSDDEGSYRGLLSSLYMLYEPDVSDLYSGYYYKDNFIELMEYVFGITEVDENIFGSVLGITDEGLVFQHGFGPISPIAEVVSVASRGGDRTFVTINYYGDTGYLFLARTIRYTLEQGERGWRFVSIECVYDSGLAPAYYSY